MDNLFQAVMYLVFGKKWLMFSMIEGYKVAIFMGRVNIEMVKPKYEKAEIEYNANVEKLEAMKLRTDFASANEKAKEIEAFQSLVNQSKGNMDRYMKEISAMYDQLSLDKNKLNFLKNFKY